MECTQARLRQRTNVLHHLWHYRHAVIPLPATPFLFARLHRQCHSEQEHKDRSTLHLGELHPTYWLRLRVSPRLVASLRLWQERGVASLQK